MDTLKWACRKNIKTWTMLLRDEPDPARRRMLTDLIIAEQNRLLQLVLSDQLNSSCDGLTGANDNR